MVTSEGSIARAGTGSIARELVGFEVLVVDQDVGIQNGIAALLAEASVHTTCVAEPEKALELVERQFFSVALIDIDTPSPGAGLATIRAIKERTPTSMIVGMTPRKSFDDAVNAVRAGAIDLILKAPESVQYLKERVIEAAGRSVGRREVDSVLVDVKTVHEEFLQKFMDAERRALDLQDRMAGKDPARSGDITDLRVLVVDEADELFDSLTEAAPDGFIFVHANSGGGALDQATAGQYHYAMVAEDVSDLPAKMLVRSLKTQSPEMVVLTFLGPAENGKVELVETAGTRTLIQPFDDPKQLISRLDEFAEAWRAKARERRYTQAFRERHYDFIRRYVEIRTKIDRAMNEGPG
jgi:DNA-binding NtrC family response regulator